jgi:hypothetical protein
MEYIENIGSTPKILKIFFAQIMFLPIKSHKTWTIKKFPFVTRRRRRRCR